jgi:hypothetical protein
MARLLQLPMEQTKYKKTQFGPQLFALAKTKPASKNSTERSCAIKTGLGGCFHWGLGGHVGRGLFWGFGKGLCRIPFVDAICADTSPIVAILSCLIKLE